MTDCLLELPLETVRSILAKEGIVPEVELTANPRGRQEGVLRVIRVLDGGRKLTCAYFLDPLAETGTKD